LVVAEPAREAARFHGLFGGDLHCSADAARCRAGGESLELLTPAAFAARWPGAPRPPVPGAGALDLGCRDAGAVRGALDRAGVPFHRRGESTWVEPGVAGGVVVEFAPGDA
ncbi:MAG: hypothetical protein ACK52I_16250, partial [Pseudomonadota bacterium]